MINFDRWEQHPRHTKCADEADQLEWKTYTIGSSPVSASQLDDEVSGSMEEVQSSRENSALEETQAGDAIPANIQQNLRNSTDERDRTEKRTEDLNAGTAAEVERRQSILGDGYPFALQAGTLVYRGQDIPAHTVYLDCLRTSVVPTSADRESFELMVVHALGAYLGDKATSQLFGWQSKSEADQPRRIKAMMADVHEKTGEWPWSPENQMPDDPPSTLVKDLGLDAMVWVKMPDNRKGKLMMIAQCATGRTDWENKLEDVSWNRIENWIRPTPHRWTIRCFAIPFHLPNTGRWNELSKKAGLFLDRARLTLLLKDSPPAYKQPQ